MKTRTCVAVLILGALSMAGVGLQAASMTLEGTVSDAKCGAKHAMKDAAACTKVCVDKGSDYALVVGDKVYTLSTASAQEKADLAKLSKRAKAAKLACETGHPEAHEIYSRNTAEEER